MPSLVQGKGEVRRKRLGEQERGEERRIGRTRRGERGQGEVIWLGSPLSGVGGLTSVPRRFRVEGGIVAYISFLRDNSDGQKKALSQNGTGSIYKKS